MATPSLNSRSTKMEWTLPERVGAKDINSDKDKVCKKCLQVKKSDRGYSVS